MNCSQCQQTLKCSADNDCWCMTLPNILPISESSGCVCRACLIKNIRTYIEDIKSKPIKAQLALARPYQNNTNFIEGIDYDMENGLLVMSRWAHLKRGKCCGNGCRHCPYK
ncbi:hypothetical protein CWB73_12400 [Pseudoalteromonas phenolica]|uniref:Cysteine-rich CWC family protein n=1 Tax=Pseudoalteromonas phenolica TaxID=161398 RepID=A0A5S3YTW8_9GAMM|nr:hypothetical protein CWB73_12400 [Pseudoalteromonas phenolica]